MKQVTIRKLISVILAIGMVLTVPVLSYASCKGENRLGEVQNFNGNPSTLPSVYYGDLRFLEEKPAGTAAYAFGNEHFIVTGEQNLIADGGVWAANATGNSRGRKACNYDGPFTVTVYYGNDARYPGQTFVKTTEYTAYHGNIIRQKTTRAEVRNVSLDMALYAR